MIIEKNNELKEREIGLWKQFKIFMREFLWTSLIDKSLFCTLTKQKKEKFSLYKMPFLDLLGYSFLSQSLNIAYIMLFVNFICNGDLVSLVFPMTALLYALLESPQPNKKYWKFLLIYILVLIILKFFY